MKPGNERFHRPVGRLEPDENKRSASLAQENRIVQVEVGNDSRHARLVFQSRLNGGQRLLAWLRIRRWQSLNHQHNRSTNGE